MNNKAIPLSIVVVVVIAIAVAIAVGNQNKPTTNPTPQQTTTTTGTSTGSTGNSIAVGEPTSSGSGSETTTSGTTGSLTGTVQSQYKDGSYSVTGTYTSPAGSESLGVSITIQDDVITGVSLNKLATNKKSIDFQSLFEEGIAGAVVGKKLDDASVSKINGSSLTPNGFNMAVAEIISQAKM